MNVTLSGKRGLRLVWGILLISSIALVGAWTVRILIRSEGRLSNAGSLALAVGSAFLALAHFDRNASRRRAWMILSFLLAFLSVGVLYVAVDRGLT